MKLATALAAAAAGGALILGGCSSTAPTGTDPSPAAQGQSVGSGIVEDAVAAAKGAGSARITGSISSTGPQGGATATLSGVQTFDPAAMDLTVASDAFGEGSGVRQVLVDGTAYVQVPELGESWVSLDVSQFAGTLSPLLTDMDLSSLPELREDGTGSVEGAAVTFYRADIDLEQALQLAGLPQQAQDEAMFAEEAGSASVRVAVDGAGRLVEWQLESTVNLADGAAMTSRADLRFFDFGVATDIAAPDAGSVVGADALAGLTGPAATP